MRPCIEQKVGNPLQKTTQQEQIIETMDGIILNNKLDSFCLSSLDHLNLVKCKKRRGMGKKFGESRGRKVKSDYQNDGFYQIRKIIKNV